MKVWGIFCYLDSLVSLYSLLKVCYAVSGASGLLLLGLSSIGDWGIGMKRSGMGEDAM